ncbi:hypothetical protein ACFFGH_09455 [Lysobacter korlensis]|uniref:Uncharacterized protein n=1 Tax=Lysobacter korlensis TaxID=553636 RepID=A0ABV6RQ52_9GAMM
MNGDDALPLSESAATRLQQYPGVQAIGLGMKETGGQLTGELAVLVLVDRKRPLSELAVDEVIPAEVDGLPTDVVEFGAAYALAAADTKKYRIEDESKVRPLIGGIQVQARHWGVNIDTGTLGCFARTREAPQRIVMLSNAHVIGDSDSDVTDAVGQPSMCSICSTCCSDTVGEVLRFRMTEHVDGAIATVDASAGTPAAQIKEIGAVAGTRPLSAQDAFSGTIEIQKRGRTTGLTFGTVRGWIVGPQNILNHNGSVNRVSRDHLLLQVRQPSECFVLDGDSGSAVLDMDRKVVGLLFGGNEKGTIGLACPIQFVTDELQIDILEATAVVPVVERAFAIAPLAGIADGPAGELLETPAGRFAAELYDTHAEEVRRLVRTNPRVSAVWRRHGGPALIHGLARAAEQPDELPLPVELNGRPVAEEIRAICDVLARYASDALRSALVLHGPRLAACGGRTLAECATMLAPRPAEAVAP